ncbi:MAG: VWA domain-containing protein [Chloroflexi bacterium]|nr:VWA domain-containing protein [Chloroflexota bacterium]
MSDFSFDRPLWLLALPLALALLPLAWVVARRSLAAASSLTREAFSPKLGVTVVLALALVLAVLAAAQPRWGERSATVQAGGAQVVAVLDVSRSMGATDTAPSRLAAARTALAEAFDRLRGDRVALVVFAGDARVRFPLTRDLAAAATVIESVEGGTLLLERGTSAASGLDLARELFDDQATGGRLVLLVSDGENLGGDPTASAAALAAEGIDLLVAGVGTPAGGVVPIRDLITGEMRPLRDRDGEAVVSRLDEAGLRAIAAAGEGRYLGANPADLPAAVRSRVAGLDQASYAATTISVPIERFHWFAAAALALVLFATAVEWRAFAPWRRAAALAPVAAAVLVVSACATAAYDLNERALQALDEGDLDSAIELLYEAQAEDPRDGQISLNLAAVLHQAGRYEEAVPVARRALADRDAAIAAAAHSSLGHHLFELGELEEALEAFGAGLLLAPDDDVMRRDYEVVWRLLHPESPPDQGAPEPSRDDDSEDGEQPPDSPQPAPGAGDAAAGEGEGEGGQQGLSPQALEQQLAAIDAQIAELREDAGEVLSAREALALLELLEERSRLAAQNPVRGVWSDPTDY